MDPFELFEILWRGLAGGAIGYIARRIFDGSQRDLEKLQSKSLESTDQDLEELLAHYVEELAEEIDNPNELTVKDSYKIIRSRTGVFATYLHLRVRRLSSEGEKPKGT